MRSVGTIGFAIACALGGVASAAPLAKLDADIDGDGAVDHVELRADGTLAIGARVVKLGGPIAAGALAVSRASKRAMIVATVTVAAGKREAVIVDAAARAELARFEIDGASVDRDFTYAVDADPRWLIRYQRVHGAERCDGKPALLFPEAFDADAKTWHAVKPPIDVDDAAPVIAARVESGAAAGAPLVYKAHLASHVPGAPDAGALGVPTELDDGKLDTAWTEALDSDGKGQFFTFEPRTTAEPAKTLRIVPGDVRSAAALRASNRPKRLAIATAAGAWWVGVPDPVATKAPLGAAYAIELPAAVTGCVTVILDETYAGDAGANSATAIAELEVYSANERGVGGEAMLAHAIADGTASGANAAGVLAARGAAGARAITDELVKATDAAARARLVGVLVQIHDPAAAPALADAAQHGWVTGEVLIAAVTALGGLKDTVALVAIARDHGVAIEARIAAIGQIDATDANALAALLELAANPAPARGGSPTIVPPARHITPRPDALPVSSLVYDEPVIGARELRAAILDALARAPIDALLAAADPKSAAPDVWRAIAKQLARPTASAEARARAIAAMTAALPRAATYEQRYRLVDGIATLGDAAALTGLAGTLAALPAGAAETAALRQVAIRAIAAAPRAAAAPLVVALLRDPDPGVRMAAVGALATSDADAASPWRVAAGPATVDRAIGALLATDRWPEVRRRAASALGDRCTRTGPAASLHAALAGDHSTPVRIDSLAALVQCRAPGVAQLLQATWDDKHAPIELRGYAVDLAVILDDRALGDVLVDRFGAWQNAAGDSTAALELAQHAAPAIGRLNPKDAVDVLADALNDAGYPELISAAAIGLAALGPACTPAAKKKLLAVSDGGDEQVAVVTKRAAAACGRAP